MNIFNSLGSNYNFGFVIKALFAKNDPANSATLVNFLEKRYKGKATLLYKGREAIELGLKSLSLPLGSFVAINGFTCFAVYEAIKKTGLEVEFLDIEKGDLNFSTEELKKHLKQNPKIKAVIIQNTLGYPCQIEQISKICQENKLVLIEDLAHSVGTKYRNGQQAGKVGNLIILSFSQDKIVDGISGGALITWKNLNLNLKGYPTKMQFIDRLYPLFTYLIRKTYPVKIGKVIHKILKTFKLLSRPMDEIGNQIYELPHWYSKLVNHAFKNLENNLNHRKKISSIYKKLINSKILSPNIIDFINLSSNLRFPIFVNNRENLIKYLNQFGVYISDIWYDAPIAPKKYLQQTDYKNQCPNAQLASEEILNLPTHINISENDARKISNLINEFVNSKTHL